MEKVTGKRVFAYIIDVIIIYMIVALFSSIEAINPMSKEYDRAATAYSDLYTDYMQAIQSNASELEILETELTSLNYDISYFGAPIIIVGIVASILYFIVFEYFNKGQTIGKKLMKIKVVSKEKGKPSFVQIACRSLIKYNILTGSSIIVGTVILILLGLASKEVYIKYAVIIQSLDMAFAAGSLICMMFKKDGRGLHDIISETLVCKVEGNSAVKEAEYVESKKTEEPKAALKKPVKKRKTNKEK